MGKRMDAQAVKTPKGARIGDRYVAEDGVLRLHVKSAKNEDDVTPEQLVECITGKRVESIKYAEG